MHSIQKVNYVITEFLTRTLTALIGGFLLFIPLLYSPFYFSIILMTLACIILFIEWPRLCPRSMTGLILTGGYIVLPLVMMMIMNQSYRQRPFLIALFIIVFSHDTFAYLCGKAWGKNLLAPQISPKKTWQGFFGGFVATFMVMDMVTRNYGKYWSIERLLVASLLITVCATLGDLLESWLKRKAYCKDSGAFLPGHGGLLDRFDSVFLVTPLFFIGSYYF